MNFLADEGVDRQIVERLRKDGHRVLYVAEMDPGMPDRSVLDVANQARAVLLTADKDFGEIVFRQRVHTLGVVLIRLAGLSPNRKAEVVASVIREHGTEILRAFTVITPSICRIRRLNKA